MARTSREREKKRPRRDEESKWEAQSDRRWGGERGVAGVDVGRDGARRERKRGRRRGREAQTAVSKIAWIKRKTRERKRRGEGRHQIRPNERKRVAAFVLFE